jgi:hypothetical protein
MFNSKYDAIIILYLILSVIWLIVTVISDFIFGGDFSSFLFYVAFTIVYIPVAYYYAREGEVSRLQESLLFTVIILIIFVVIQGIRSTALLCDTI